MHKTKQPRRRGSADERPAVRIGWTEGGLTEKTLEGSRGGSKHIPGHRHSREREQQVQSTKALRWDHTWRVVGIAS